MKKLKEIAWLLLECNLGIRPIARVCNISTSVASEKTHPSERFVIASWTKAKVHIDYHVKVEKTYFKVNYLTIIDSHETVLNSF